MEETFDITYEDIARALGAPVSHANGLFGPGVVGTASIEHSPECISPTDYEDCITHYQGYAYVSNMPWIRSLNEMVFIGDSVPSFIIEGIDRYRAEHYNDYISERAFSRWLGLHGYEVSEYTSQGYCQSDWIELTCISPKGTNAIDKDTFDSLMWGDIYNIHVSIESPNGDEYEDTLGMCIGYDYARAEIDPLIASTVREIIKDRQTLHS